MDIKKLIPDLNIRAWVGPFDEECYFSSGKEQTEKIKYLLSIKPDSQVLDLGCGCGRIAIHFLDYLSPQGKYLGIDNNTNLLSFCTGYIAPLNENFKFEYIDVYNGEYAPEGKLKCHEVVLPLENDSVDVVIMWSVFTHMYLYDIDPYLKEIHRVLKLGGRFISSFNLYNDFIENQIVMNKSHLDIRYKINDDSFSLNKEVPEQGFAHREDRVIECYTKNDLTIKQITYGVWSNKELLGEFHDYIIAQK